MFSKTVAQKNAVKLLSTGSKWTLLFGGSRSGKTFILVYAIVIRALKAPRTRHAIFRYRFNHIKASIFQDTLPKVLNLCFPHVKAVFNHTDYTVTLPNDSIIIIGGLDDKERTEKILGQEFSTLYLNEASQIPYASAQMALTRLAERSVLKNKVFVDANPPTKQHWLYKLFVKKIDPITNAAVIGPDQYQLMRINPEENRENISEDYIETTLAGLSERARKRFLMGEWLDDAEGALWNRELINASRIVNCPRDFARIVVGIDPAVTAKEGSDSTGIVVAGMDARGHYYVLEDKTMEKASPGVWGLAAVTAYEHWHADAIIGETNNGGDLVEMNIRRISDNVRYKGVHASRGKIVRAEPIAGLYEQGKVHHVGEFPELEDQMCSFAPALMGESGTHDDRADALVWALTELSGMTKSHIRATGRTIK